MVARAVPSSDDVVIRRAETVYTVELGSTPPQYECRTFESALEQAGALAASYEARVWYTGDNTRFIALTDNGLLLRAWAEFMEMPGLGLTRLQAQRLWGVDDRTCQDLLDGLVALQFPVRGADGRYRRASDGREATALARLAGPQAKPAAQHRAAGHTRRR